MADHEKGGMVSTLLAPLMLPGRAAKDLEAIGTAARDLPAFERTLLDQLAEPGPCTGGAAGAIGDCGP